MRWSFVYHPDVRDDIRRIPANIRRIIQRAIEERLGSDPVKFGDPLKRGLQGYRKLRVGDYRVIYRVNAADIIILMIGHRKDLYEKVEQRIK
jgi:mRNA interferase RelE/StbE